MCVMAVGHRAMGHHCPRLCGAAHPGTGVRLHLNRAEQDALASWCLLAAGIGNVDLLMPFWKEKEGL